ncbi:hypothetical protein LZC95_17755 [Pendulispora brunnea]|uniref:Uncharacterized protein n=1 Tax=Pendulispora brunnea TaxID=2905690 RepID=A0ABZ2KNV1_9BACT
MRRIDAMAWAAGALVSWFSWFACASCTSHDERTCYRGEYRACACGKDRSGLAACLDTENDYGACDCSGAIPGLELDGGVGDGGLETDAGHEAGAKLPFLQPCDVNEQCETGLCFPFNAKGPHCSKSCKSDGDCPVPSPGCNNMHVCKVP